MSLKNRSEIFRKQVEMDNQFLLTAPPMGWNSWNTFYDQVSESLIRSTADAFIEKGLAAAGYEYLVIDDCWSMRSRDEHGRLVPDPAKFPNGMKALADYVHDKGLKLGIYSCCGVHTCAGYPGSFEHEFSDAAQFAEWGIDYLKYDNCFHPQAISSELLYRRMNLALRSCGRDILLAACQWGRDQVHSWIRSTGAHTFRSTVDIQDAWKSIETIALSQLDQQPMCGNGCYNDMDILVAGMYGKGLNPETSIGGCNETEYQTHFALWAMMNSPLIIGCDVRNMDEKTCAILTNPDLIAINQDPEGRSCHKISTYGSPDAFILIKQLAGDEWAAGFFNFGDAPAHVELHFWDMGLPLASGYGFTFHDCLTHEDLGVKKESHAQKVAAHGCQVYRMKLKKLD